MTLRSDPADPPSPPSLPRALIAASLAALLLAVGTLALSSHPNASRGAAIGGVAWLVSTLTALGMALRGGERRLTGATWWLALAHAAATATVAIHVGLAVPEDLHLFTLGRPPQACFGYALIASALAFDGIAAILRSRPARTAFLPLLVAAAALEGLPLATPPWLLLGLAAVAFVAAPSSSPARSFAVPIACGALALAYGISGALGADPGESLDPTLRVTALALIAACITGEGAPGARRVFATLLLGAIALGVFALKSKLLLARATAGLDIDVLGSELSLFGRHPNSLAPWFGASAILAFAAARAWSAEGDGRARRLLAWAAIPFALGALLLTASRLAIAATIGAVVLGLAMRTRSGRRGLAIGAGIAIAATVLAIGAVAIPPLRAKLQESLDAAQSLDHRSFRMRVGIATALESPWLGHGPLCWFTQGPSTPKTNYEGETSEDHPHSLPIALWEGTGAVGIAVFAALLAAIALAARRAIRRDDGRIDAPDAILAQGALLATIAQLSTNLLDMGDALDTLIPSRLPIDAALIAALAPPFAAERVRKNGALTTLPVAVAIALGVAAAFVGFARQQANHARELARQGHSERALRQFESATALLPIDASLHLEQARAAFAAKRRVDARDAIDRALAIAPNRPDAHEALAALRLALDDRSGARAAATRAIELDPHGATPRRLGMILAELELDAGDEAAALEILARTVRIDARAFSDARIPDRPDRLRIGRHEVELTRVYDALRASVSETTAALEAMRVDLRILELALSAGDLATAETSLARLRVLVPDALSNEKFEGKLRLAQGRHDEALAAFDRAGARLSDPGLLADRGDALLGAGKIEEALAAYRAALPSARDVYFHAYAYHDALSRLASALERAGDRHRAELATTWSSLAFFIAADLDRARALVREAEARDDSDAKDRALRRALFALLRCDDSPAVRALATDLGIAIAELHRDATGPSELADDLEREALARNPGAPAHAFRVALLSGLGLARRAADAERDLLAFQR